MHLPHHGSEFSRLIRFVIEIDRESSPRDLVTSMFDPKTRSTSPPGLGDNGLSPGERAASRTHDLVRRENKISPRVAFCQAKFDPRPWRRENRRPHPLIFACRGFGPGTSEGTGSASVQGSQEIVNFEWESGRGAGIAYMIDQSHDLKG